MPLALAVWITLVDHYTYVLGGDGCFMEGISSEAFSLAGTLKLDKLVVLYDSNNISIEESTDIAFTEDVKMRMEAFGFNVFKVEDGDNLEEILNAINEAKKSVGKPAFIEVKTKIGKGCPAKEGKASAHGEPLGADNVIELKKNLGLPEDKDFYVDEEVYNHIASEQERANKVYEAWNKMFEEYFVKYPDMKKVWQQKRWQKAENTTQSFVLAPLSGVLHRILIMFVQKFQKVWQTFLWTVKFLLFLE